MGSSVSGTSFVPGVYDAEGVGCRHPVRSLGGLTPTVVGGSIVPLIGTKDGWRLSGIPFGSIRVLVFSSSLASGRT